MRRSVVVDEIVLVEDQIQVLERLGQEERLHPVVQRVVLDVLHLENSHAIKRLLTRLIFFLINRSSSELTGDVPTDRGVSAGRSTAVLYGLHHVYGHV